MVYNSVTNRSQDAKPPDVSGYGGSRDPPHKSEKISENGLIPGEIKKVLLGVAVTVIAVTAARRGVTSLVIRHSRVGRNPEPEADAFSKRAAYARSDTQRENGSGPDPRG